jgi:hypothetical protein
MASKRDQEKAAHEMAVFLAFAEHAAREGMIIRRGSAVSRPPPEPDILCDVEGEGLVAFELAEIIDPVLAENISVAVRKNVPADGAGLDPVRWTV